MISDVGTSLVVQFLRIHACSAGNMGLNPGQGTKIPGALKCSQGGEKRCNEAQILNMDI